MRKVVIYHNPRCSTSRKTLALLKERGLNPDVIEYLTNPPSKQDIKHFITLLGGDAQALLRTKEPAYKDSGLTPSSSADEIAEAIVANPVLLERPLVVAGNKAAMGRPPATVLTILD